MKPRYYYPAKPFVVNQRWGIFNPAYQQFGFTRHNGTDFRLGADKKVRYPWEGSGTVVRVANQPNGGGIYVSVMSHNIFADVGEPYVILTDFLHLETVLVREGDKVKIGDVLAIADNTGFTTGPHTHEQDRRIKGWNGKVGSALNFELLDRNEANDSFDQLEYATGLHAEDYGTWRAILLEIIKRLTKAT